MKDDDDDRSVSGSATDSTRPVVESVCQSVSQSVMPDVEDEWVGGRGVR